MADNRPPTLTHEEIAKAMRRASRKGNRMPQGGVHGSKKGRRGYSRKAKHPAQEEGK